jgi:hypothetical protein
MHVTLNRAGPFLRNQYLLSYSRNPTPFMEHEGPLRRVAGHYPELVQFRTHIWILFLKHPFM